jgi:Tol biopolymer transport system component
MGALTAACRDDGMRTRRLVVALALASLLAMGCAPASSSVASPSSPQPAASPRSEAPSATTALAALPGGRLAFARDIGEVGSLFTSKPDGTDIKPLLPAGASPHWSPDGRHIAIVANNRQGRLFVGLVDPDGSHYVQFDRPDPTLDLGCFAWSPDGSRLACEGWDDTDAARNGMYTVSATDGGDLTRVTASPAGHHEIPTDYSTDGRQIVFVRQKLSNEADSTLMIANVDGIGVRLIAAQGTPTGPLSPDGRTILAVANGSLVLVPIDGGAITTVKIISASNLNPDGPGWSPDGQWIVFSGHNATSSDLYIVRTDGTDLHQTTNTPGQWEGDVDWGNGP